MARTVTAWTLDVFTGTDGAALVFAPVTVLLVRMGHPQVRFWGDIVGDIWKGTAPVEGYEVRASDGSLLGAILPLGHKATRLQVEWYDPEADDFYGAGETDAVMTQGVARVLDARRRHVGEVPLGRDLALDPERLRSRRNKACPFNYCFDPYCIDHGPVWFPASEAVIRASGIELDGGDAMLQEMSVGEPIQIDKQNGLLTPGIWVITSFENDDHSCASVRRLTQEEIDSARRREADASMYQ